jgi:hypothetical protein
MTDRDDLLRRVRRVNPAPPGEPLPSDVADSRPPVAWLIERNPFMEGSKHATGPGKAPLVAAVAAMVALAIALPMLITNSDEEDRVPMTTAATVTTTGSSATTTTLATPAGTTNTTVPPAIIPLAAGTPFESSAFTRMDAVSADESWVVLGQARIGHWMNGRWTYFGFAEGSGDNPLRPNCQYCIAATTSEIRDVAADADGLVWAATDLGVFSFDGIVWIRRLEPGAGAVGIDQEGTVWIGGVGSARGGQPSSLWLAFQDAGSWLNYPWGFYGRDPREVRLSVLGNGDVWIASFGWFGEVGRHTGDPGAPAYFDSPIPVPGQSVAFALAPDGVVWTVGTRDAGEAAMVARLDGETWTLLDLPEGVGPQGWLWDIAFDADGTMWVVGPQGIASFDGVEWTSRASDAIAMDISRDGTIVYLDREGGIHTIG